jgi:hypothetical protein
MVRQKSGGNLRNIALEVQSYSTNQNAVIHEFLSLLTQGLSRIRPPEFRSKPRDHGGLIQSIKVDLQTNNAFDLINSQRGKFCRNGLGQRKPSIGIIEEVAKSLSRPAGRCNGGANMGGTLAGKV